MVVWRKRIRAPGSGRDELVEDVLVLDQLFLLRSWLLTATSGLLCGFGEVGMCRAEQGGFIHATSDGANATWAGLGGKVILLADT